MNELSPNSHAWILLGIPALLAWMGVLAATLLAPHLPTDPVPLNWAGAITGAWYSLMALCYGGYWGALVLGHMD